MSEQFKPARSNEYYFWSDRDHRRTGMTPHDFITRLVADFQIGSVYYPGSGDDFTLARVFPPNGVFYLDESSYDGRRFQRRKEDGHFVIGDMKKSPFLDGVFDALYVQDIHASAAELKGILRKVKPGGIVIFSMDDCEDGDLDDLNRLRHSSQLHELKLPYRSGMFHVFQKKDTPVANPVNK